MWRLISIDRLLSLKFKYSEMTMRCDDELTGKNSVIP